MGFLPISIEDYVARHVEANPEEDKAEVESRLRKALSAYKAGEQCDCGEPIWVIGSAVAGYACFTCITGEAVPESDFEIKGAMDKGRR